MNKPDGGNEGKPVLQNWNGELSVSFSFKFFYKRDNPVNLHKDTISSQEWCGITFKLFDQFEGGYKFNYNSYWDGEGEGNYDLEMEAIFEDQLSLSLRSLNFKRWFKIKL